MTVSVISDDCVSDHVPVMATLVKTTSAMIGDAAAARVDIDAGCCGLMCGITIFCVVKATSSRSRGRGHRSFDAGR
jgi:hypothetical protein